MDFSSRHRARELMDQPGLAERLHGQALRGLRRINRVCGSGRILWSAIRELAGGQRPDQFSAGSPDHLAPGESPGAKSSGPLRILDIACGGGDVTLDVARRATAAGCDVEVAGCDVSPFAVRYARQQAVESGFEASFFELDVLADPLPRDYDVLMCSLFLHHLAEPQAVDLLRRMSAAAGRLVLVSDLRRTRAGYWLAWIGCRLLTRSPVVHADGPVSVAAAFSLDEAAELARKAGIKPDSIEPDSQSPAPTSPVLTRRWPQRFLLAWRRT